MEDGLIYSCNKLDLNYYKKLMKQNLWKSFATIHAGLHHQLKIILRYKFDKDVDGRYLGHHFEKWGIIDKKYFAPLVKDLFVVGVIDSKLKSKLIKFNDERNKKLGHIRVYDKTNISSKDIRSLCLNGIKLIEELDKIIHLIFFP